MKYIISGVVLCTSMLSVVPVQAQTIHEYVEAVGSELRTSAFSTVITCGQARADVETTSTGVKLRMRSGTKAFDDEVLRAANAVYSKSVPSGYAFPVTYAAVAGVCYTTRY